MQYWLLETVPSLLPIVGGVRDAAALPRGLKYFIHPRSKGVLKGIAELEKTGKVSVITGSCYLCR